MKLRALPATFMVLLTALGAVSAQAALPSTAGDAPVPTLAPMIKRVSPTVVGIATRGTVQQQRNPLFEDPFFRRFFEVPPESTPRERPLAAGSGVVVDAKNGYIVTNAHVVANASKITVTLDDGNDVSAEVVGSDEGSDIALLKVKEGKLDAIALGDSSAVEVGDFVVAIGNPFGLEHTVTSGIVSALGRSGIGPDRSNTYQDFIQTDASINPGNSGGALVNLRGELVGINAAILSGGGGNIGIGFAIPINMVKSVVDQLIQYGEVKRGILGVRISTLTPDIAKAVGAGNDVQGALVAQVEKASAAEQAGIKVGDIITGINGKGVRSDVELRNAIGLLRVGEKVKIGLLREGKSQTVTATITKAASTEETEANAIHAGFEGAELADAEGSEGGIAVRGVAPGSPASQYGLRPNDVIYGVNRLRVKNLQELREAAKNANSLVLNVRRGGSALLILMR